MSAVTLPPARTLLPPSGMAAVLWLCGVGRAAGRAALWPSPTPPAASSPDGAGDAPPATEPACDAAVGGHQHELAA